jgi:hypothetical protein
MAALRAGATTLLLGLAAGALFVPLEARADATCRSISQRAEQEERAGHLLQARESFASCAKASCGDAVNRQCRSAFKRLDREDIPSVVVRALDDHNRPLDAVAVIVDGTVVATEADGRSLELDPGLHQFSFRAGNAEFGAQKVLLAQGDRNHVVSVTLAAPSPPPEKEATAPATRAAATAMSASPTPPAPPPDPADPGTHSSVPFVFGAGAVLGGTAAAAAAVSFSKGNDTTSIGIDISVGVGVAAVFIVGWFIATHGSSSRTGARGTTLRPEGAAFPWLSGSF